MIKHGKAGQRIYRVWAMMIQRCSNPNNDQFKNYGGRGITVCPDWQNAATFISWALANGYRDDLEIDRRDNDLGYEPGNCHFVTSSRNKRNTRKTVMIEWQGKPMPLADLADMTGIHKNTLRRRILKLGMSAEQAVKAPRDTWQTRRSFSSQLQAA